MKLNLVNNLTKVVYDIENLTDLKVNQLNYAFDIQVPAGIDDGEYNYTLFDDDDNIVATGILQIGSYEPEKQSYTAQTNNGYIQYEG